MSIAASTIVAGSNWGSHTLVTYSLLRQMGLARDPAVGTVVGATAVTDTSALLVLAIPFVDDWVLEQVVEWDPGPRLDPLHPGARDVRPVPRRRAGRPGDRRPDQPAPGADR